MVPQRCIDFANNNTTCYLATIDGDQPRVRAFQLWFADADGFHFITLSGKPVCSQLKGHPLVEVCFFNNKEGDDALMMRVSGRLRFERDAETRRKALESRARAQKYVKGPEDEQFQVFTLYTGEAFFWTFSDILKERQLQRLPL